MDNLDGQDKIINNLLSQTLYNTKVYSNVTIKLFKTRCVVYYCDIISCSNH